MALCPLVHLCILSHGCGIGEGETVLITSIAEVHAGAPGISDAL